MASDLHVRLVLQAIDRSTAVINRIKGKFGELTDAGSKAQKSFKLAANVRQTAQAVGALARVSRSAIAGPTEAFEDFAQSMATVRSTTNATAAEFKVLEAEAQKIGGSIGEFTTKQVADGMIEMGRAGKTTAQIIELMPTTLDLATVGGIELSQAILTLTKTMGGFGLTGKDSGKAADILAATVNNASTNMGDLFEALKQVSGSARKAGSDLQTTATLVGGLALSGTDAQKAGTTLRAFFANITKPTPTAKAALKAIGVSVTETVDGVEKLKDPIRLLGDFQKALSERSELGGAKALGDIFGKRFQSNIGNLISSLGTDDFKKLQIGIKNSTGALKNYAKIQRDQAKNATLEMESAVGNLAITIGGVLEPVLAPLKTLVRDAAIAITGWAKRNPFLAKTLAVLAVAFAAITTVLAGFLIVLSSAIAAVGAYQIAVMLGLVPSLGALSAAAVSSGAAFLAANAPILVVGAALIGVALAIQAVIDNWDDLKASFSGTGFLQNLANQLPGARNDQIDAASQAAQALARAKSERQKRIDAGVSIPEEQEKQFQSLLRADVEGRASAGLAPIANASESRARIQVEVFGKDGAGGRVADATADAGINLDVAHGGGAFL